ncbi:hypothetical protein C8R46DRAFT_609170 [Mycena filopes]|nr:hypothetical protein C8R46DRAFT_609170 [Mycena filopes]
MKRGGLRTAALSYEATATRNRPCSSDPIPGVEGRPAGTWNLELIGIAIRAAAKHNVGQRALVAKAHAHGASRRIGQSTVNWPFRILVSALAPFGERRRSHSQWIPPDPSLGTSGSRTTQQLLANFHMYALIISHLHAYGVLGYYWGAVQRFPRRPARETVSNLGRGSGELGRLV